MTRCATLIFVISIATVPIALGADPPGSDQVVRRITNEWKGRHNSITSLKCSAKLDTFYPKGYLTELQELGKPANQRGQGSDEKDPPEDRRFSEETYSLAIDFAAQRVRKEYQRTSSREYGNAIKPRFFLDHSLHLYTDGKYTVFNSRDPGAEPDASTTFYPDAVVHEGASAQFLLTIEDLPLLWIAGGVNGRWPIPAMMRYLDSIPAFTYRGEAEWKGHKCFILSVQEQNSPRGVREFWVDRASPYPIYYCRARDRDKVYWQVEADYQQRGDHLLPVRWTVTGYHSPQGGTLFRQTTFEVQELELNPRLGEQLFVKRLEPGMRVFSTERNEKMEVDSKGNLVPLGSPRSGPLPAALIWCGCLLGLVIAVSAFYRYGWKRRGASEHLAE